MTFRKPPSNIKSLLGLNLKFIPRPKFTTHDLDDTITRFRQQVYIQDFYQNNPVDNRNEELPLHIPKLHIPTHWIPSIWKISESTIARTNEFLHYTKKLFFKKRCTPNLSSSQLHILNQLRKKEHFVITKADKNLGPCILETETYIKYALKDHLHCKNTYKKLSKSSASIHMDNVKKIVNKFLYQHRKNLPKQSIRYIRVKTKECTNPFPQLYLLMKVHKKPLKTRPVVSCSGSLLHPMGVWLDTALQPIATSLPSFIASSYDLKEALNALPTLPQEAKLFTGDAVSMYTNIDTFYALSAIKNFLENQEEYKALPLPAILDALEIIMNNNVFQFGDCYFHQRTGTAMGTPPACCYATIYYAVREKFLHDKYRDNLFFYKRYIDDVFGIWVPNNPQITFEEFAQDMNYHKLRWETNKPSDNVVFLDMILQIKNGRIVTELYEKALNLYLYISPSSAHSPGVLSGLIIGNILRIHHLCTERTVRKEFYEKFFLRLRARGYQPSQLIPLFERGLKLAIHKPMPSTRNKKLQLLKQQSNLMNNPNKTNDRVILHIPYHPKDPISWEIQRIFRRKFLQNECSTIGFSRLTVAYSRPKNLGELLSYRRIDSYNCPPVSSNFVTRDPWAGFFRS